MLAGDATMQLCQLKETEEEKAFFLDLCESLYRQAVSTDRTSQAAQMRLGMLLCKYRPKMIDEAENHLLKSLELAQDSEEVDGMVLKCLVKVLERKNSMEQAAKLREYIQYFPNLVMSNPASPTEISPTMPRKAEEKSVTIEPKPKKKERDGKKEREVFARQKAHSMVDRKGGAMRRQSTNSSIPEIQHDDLMASGSSESTPVMKRRTSFGTGSSEANLLAPPKNGSAPVSPKGGLTTSSPDVSTKKEKQKREKKSIFRKKSEHK
jgi:hypothetical protein